MRKVFLYIIACVSVITACSISESELERKDVVSNEDNVVTLFASVVEDSTKVSIVDHKYNWQAGDQIAVFQDDGTKAPIAFTASSSAASSAFTASTDKTIGKYAVYPYDTADESDFEWEEVTGDDIMIIALPDSYDYQADALNIPMLGKISGSNISFKALGGVLRFTLTNIPAEAAYFVFEATNKNIAGLFEIVASDTTPVVEMTDGTSDNAVVIAFTAGAASTLTFSVPVPIGTIDGFSMTLWDSGLDDIYSVASTADIVVDRNEVITAPTWHIPDVDVINRVFTGVAVGTSYSAWSNKSGQSSSAKYAGNSAGGKDADALYGALQLRPNTNSGIVSTTTGGLIRKIVVDWNSVTPDSRVLDIYGKQTPYLSSADLYEESTRGVKIGSIVKGTSTELAIPKNQYYPYVGIRSNNYTQYFNSITIAWDEDNRSILTAPTFSEAEGEIPAGTTVTISNAEGGTIHYTIDGSTPDEGSTTYSSGIVVSDNITIKAVALKDGYKISSVSSISYTVPVCAAPTFDTAEGDISSGSDVTIENNESGSVIYYTTDGSDPDGSSSYGAAGADVVISNIISPTTIKAISRVSGKKDSPIAEAYYTIAGSATPLIAPTTITFEPYTSSFTATWEKNDNASGYEWVVSTSTTAAGIVKTGVGANVPEGGYGSFSVSDLTGTGASLSSSTWTLTKSIALSLSTRYYFYILVKGNGTTFSDSDYSSPVNRIVPLVINVSNLAAGSYSADEKTFTTNLIQFGYVQVMQNGKGNPTNWAANQTMQFKGNSTTPGILYNKDALGTAIKSIRIYLTVNNNAFTLAYGTDTSVNTGSKTRMQSDSSGSFYISVNHKDGGSLTNQTVNYYEYDLSSFDVNYFKITNGSSANYIWKIEIAYQ